MDKEFFAALPPETALIAGAVLGALGCILLVLKIIKEFQGIQGTARSTAMIFIFVVLGLFSILYAQASYKHKSDSLEQEKNQLSDDVEELEKTINENDTYIAQLESDKTDLKKEFSALSASMQAQTMAESSIKNELDAQRVRLQELSNKIVSLTKERDFLLKRLQIATTPLPK